MSSPFQVSIKNNSKIPTTSNFLYLNIIDINLAGVGCIWRKPYNKFYLYLGLVYLLNIVLLAASATDEAVLRAKKLFK